MTAGQHAKGGAKLRLRRPTRRPTLPHKHGEEGRPEEALSPLAFALAHALTLEDWPALGVRCGLASFLRRYELGPKQLQNGALEAHKVGYMRAGKLTPEGVRAALLVLAKLD